MTRTRPLRMRDVEQLLTSWGYRSPREAVRWWRRRGWITPVATPGGQPLYDFGDLVRAEATARANRPGAARRAAARRRALARFEELVAAGAVPTRPPTSDDASVHEIPRG
jgi:hypothetical protein